MLKNILNFIMSVFICGIATAQSAVDSTSEIGSKIITRDIENFWKAFDALSNQVTYGDSLKIIQHGIIANASIGFHQYLAAANCNEDIILKTIKSRKNDYLRIRSQTEAISTTTRGILTSLNQFQKIYPQLKIPTICYSIGIFQVGGSSFDQTLYIGCEADALKGIEILPQSIHELAHFQQIDQKPQTNLELAMIEGGAEFITYSVTGRRTIYAAWQYGSRHQEKLWREFKTILDSPVDMNWFRDVRDIHKNRPGSLGYFIGFKICEAYYKNHKNKALAIKDIISMINPERMFFASEFML